MTNCCEVIIPHPDLRPRPTSTPNTGSVNRDPSSCPPADTETQVSTMLKVYTISHPPPVKTTLVQPEPKPDPLTALLSPLQRDALLLSERLLSFLEVQGSPPKPKYTREEIDKMSLAESRRLLDSNDGDYAFACEYHFGQNFDKGRCETPQQLAALMLARFM